MKVDEYIEIQAEAFIMESLVSILPSDFESRQLRIQINKLHRMLDSAPEISGPGASIKKFNVRQGKHHAAVGKQLKLVRSLAKQSFKAWKRLSDPKLTNRAFEDWQAKFREAMSVQAKTMVSKARQLAGSK